MRGKRNSHELYPSNITVLIGVHNVSKLNEEGRVNASVKAIHVHPDWNVDVDAYDADIAVLELENEIRFTNFIQPICLNDSESLIAVTTDGIVAGFGRTENRKYSNVAKKLEIPILSYHNCTKNKRKLHQFVSARTFCGGPGDGRGVCDGDSGSGLYVTYGDSYYLRGIVSASLMNTVNECNVDTFAVFTDAAKHTEWIRSFGNPNHKLGSEVTSTPAIEQRQVCKF